MEHLLFVYGTLLDKEIRTLLLGSIEKVQPAILQNHAIYTDNGYNFLKKENGTDIYGAVLSLTTQQLLTADQWEEIPFYRRQKIEVEINGKFISVWYYNRFGVQGVKSLDKTLHNFSGIELKNIIDDFKGQRLKDTLPFCDCYILFPVSIKSIPSNNSPDEFIESLNSISSGEFNSFLSSKILRTSLCDIEIAAFSCDGKSELGHEKASLYVSSFAEAGYGVLYVSIPAVSIPLLYLLDQVSRGGVMLRSVGTKDFVNISDFLETKGIQICGTPRSAVFLSSRPDDDSFKSLLLGEVESPAKITGEKVTPLLIENIAQYSSAQIFASEINLAEIPQYFEIDYERRLGGQTLTLFILELIQLQEAALSGVNTKILNSISDRIYLSDSYALKKIEELTEEYAKAMLLWDIRNFRYRTAQQLADELAAKFRMDKKFEIFFSYKNLLEQLTNIHSSRINISETRILNVVLLLLAFIQIAPVIFNISKAFISNDFLKIDVVASLSAIAGCFVIWMLFRLAVSRAALTR